MIQADRKMVHAYHGPDGSLLKASQLTSVTFPVTASSLAGLYSTK